MGTLRRQECCRARTDRTQAEDAGRHAAAGLIDADQVARAIHRCIERLRQTRLVDHVVLGGIGAGVLFLHERIPTPPMIATHLEVATQAADQVAADAVIRVIARAQFVGTTAGTDDAGGAIAIRIEDMRVVGKELAHGRQQHRVVGEVGNQQRRRTRAGRYRRE
ncbi:hypothetical protein D3C71_1385060 [compost metagenome]